MQRILLAATLCVGMACTANAATVDFSQNFGVPLAEGTEITNFDFGSGLTGSVEAVGGTDQAIVLDTVPPSAGTTNDPDLASPFQNVNDLTEFRSFGNALIVQEGGGSPVPDDVVGGSLTFTFDNLINLASVTLLDVEEGTSISVNGSVVATGGVNNTGLPNGGPNQFITLILNLTGISNFTVDFEGSGAVGEFDAAVVPLPAALPLLLGALGLLGGLGWRRRRQQTA